MKRSLQIIVFVFLFSIVTYNLQLTTHNNVFAQEGSSNYGAAITYKVDTDKYDDGDIVSLTDQQDTLRLTQKEYDDQIFGVIVTKPAMVFRRPIDNGVPILRTGQVFVNVTDYNGAITTGDYVTGSPIPGKAMKATNVNSHVLGVAIAGFDKSLGTDLEFKGKKVSQGKVLISLGIGPASPIIAKAEGGILGTLKNLSRALFFNINASQQTDKVIRYIVALLIILLTVVINYRTFARNISKGIEAIGRNPLAKKTIQSMIILNGILIAIVTILGVILALAVISL
jgi:F0F1-type ATP synthase membrane subunit c/vacuolar-type H+-ATPase subunit K